MSFATHTTDVRAPRFRGTSRALSSLRDSVRRRRIERAGRRDVARKIAAYPATRSVALTVLPARQHEAA
jgi:hypothetical protein